MKSTLLITSLLTVLLLSCHKVPLTGRKSMSLIPENTMQALALNEYKGFLSKNPPITQGADAAMLARIGQKLSSAVKTYMSTKKMGSQLNGYSWDFNLISDNQVNAWCMPGAKVVVYSGLLPVTANEAGLAAVIGHEISHALARHGSERMTQGLLAQGISITGDILLQRNPQVNAIFQQSFGIGGSLGMLAFSRKHEYEADKMGMIFMAMAGYHPSEAIEVWKRMAARGGPKPPEILSTHPGDANRIKHLQSAMKDAMVFYRP